MAKRTLSNLINSIFTTNGMKEITGQKTRETLNTFLDGVYLPAGFTSDWFGISIPEGWHLMDGSEFAIPANETDDYWDLFNNLGAYLSPYGVNVENGTFQIPLIPAGTTTVQRGVGFTLGSKGGEKTHVLTVNEIPSHRHSLDGFHSATIDGTGSQGGIEDAPGTTVNTSYSGGGLAHNNMPPYICANKIIKLH